MLDRSFRQYARAARSLFSVPQRYGDPTPCQTLDLARNYWFTSEADSVGAWIWDGNDGPSIGATVQYLPILTSEPVPVLKPNMGGLKAG